MMRTLAKIIHFIVALAVLTLFNGCNENEQPQIVPYTNVNLIMSLNLPQFSPLSFSGNAIVVNNQGYKGNGVIVYRLVDDFYAFDATCPQHISTATAIELDGVSAGTATCPSCGTTYVLMTGFALDDDSAYPLQSYTAWCTGNTVYVNN